jgi:hypothetical protein
MSSSVPKVSSSKSKKKKPASADTSVTARLNAAADSFVSPLATKTTASSTAGRGRSPSSSDDSLGNEGSRSGKEESPSDDEVPLGMPPSGQFRQKDFEVVVLTGLPDSSGDCPATVKALLSQGVKPLEKVTVDDLLDELGPSKQLRARLDYPDWELLIAKHSLQGIFSGGADKTPRDYFSPTVVCRDNTRQLAEIIICILISSESSNTSFNYVDRLFRELWVFLFRLGVRADDGLALLDFQDLQFPDLLLHLGQLSVRKSLWQIIQAVKVTQSLSPRLYLTRQVPFSLIMRIVSDPNIVTGIDSSVALQNGSRTVTFDASVKSHAPPDLELPMLALDASDFLDYRKSVEYVFQSRGVKQYLTETNASQLVSSWSEAFCARLHASIAKSTISYINEQLKNESSVARLWDGIKNCFNDAGQQLDRELRTWITLFQLTVDHIDDFASFLNTYKTAMSQLRAVNSIALGDAALMRALIIRSVTCEEFHSVMIDLSKNRSIQPDDMIKALEDHYRAHQHRATIAGHSSSGTKAIRRGAKSDSAAGADKGSSSATKLGWNVPPFPRTLHDCVGGFIFNQLKKWRVHCSKDNYTAEDETMRKNWVIYKTPEGTKHGGGGDKGRSRDSDGNRKNRGSKKNHHRNKDRRGRRGDRRSRSRSRDKDSESDYDSVESDRSYERRESRRGERRSSRHGSGRSRSRSADRDRSPSGRDAGVLFGGRRSKKS